MEGDYLRTLLQNSNHLKADLKLRYTDKRIGAPIFFAELTLVACLTGLLVSCLSVDRFEHFKIWGLEAWRWWTLLFVIVTAGMAVGLLMDVVLVSLDHANSALGRIKLEVGERALKLGERVLQVVCASRGSIQAVFWIGSILIAWILLFRMGVKLPEHRSGIMNRVTQGLAGLLIGTVLWLLKNVWLQLLAFSLIVDRPKERVEQAQADQKWLSQLWETIFHLANKPDIIKPEETGTPKVLPDEKKLITRKRQWTPESIIHKIAGTDLPVLVEDKEDTDNVQRAARVTAGWLFETIKAICGVENSVSDNHKRKTKFIIMKESQKYKQLQENLEKVTSGSRSFEFTLKKVRLISKEDRMRSLRRSDLEGWLEKIYIDRIVLLRTINGWDDIVCELNRIVSVMLFVVNIVVWLFVTGLLTTTVAIAIAAQVIAFNFMFGTSAKTTFKAFFFVFKSQPFAVGDRCKIDGDDYEMVVHDMNFLSTIFTKSDGEKIYYPNSVLIDKNIDNFVSVPDARDVIEFFVGLQGDGNDVAEMTRQKIKEEIDKFLGGREKKWTKDFNVEIYELSKEKKIHIVILTVNHNVNFHNGGDKAKRRDELLRKLHYILRNELKIDCIDCNTCREALNLPKTPKNVEVAITIGDDAEN